jgi:CSLREA domain-containing protein
VIFLLTCGSAHAGLPIVVNETGDVSDPTPDGVCDVSADPGSQCTLRAAIESANNFVTTDGINFSIPGSGVHTIAVQSPLPAIQAPVIINGYSQAGASPNTDGPPQPLTTQIKVFLDGDALGEGAGLGFDTVSSGSSVQGLAIGNFPAAAIRASVPVTIQGNFLGTNAAGTGARPNGRGFFGAVGSANAQLGGPDFDDANLISGNLGEAIFTDAAVNIQGNYIGTERNGKAPLPNTTEGNLFGVVLSGDGSDEVTRNIIANSSAGGVSVPEANLGSLISANRMFKNDGPGIDLGEDGVTPNDDMDVDSGPNDLQNFPIINKAKRGETTTKVKFELNSLPSEGFIVEFFQADGKSRQGKIYLGGAGFTTDGDGNAHFAIELAKPKQGKYVTATATRIAGGDDGSTSEFAKPVQVK